MLAGSRKHSFQAYAGLPLLFSCPVSVLRSSFLTVSVLFIAGKSNLSSPPLNPFHLPYVFLFVQTNAPTHGCTFQCRLSVAFVRSAIFPDMSVIWYFGFWLSSLTIPGLPPAGYGFIVLRDDFDFDFVVDLEAGWTYVFGWNGE